MTDFPIIDVPDDLIAFKYPMRRFADALRSDRPARIVAIGSSSTAGREDVVPYPHRLEMYLRVHYQERFPNLKIDVLNRGKGGEDAGEELARFESDVIAESPSLVIWQVGTNAIFHNYNIDEVTANIGAGLAQLARHNLDVILIDPQYVTAMLLDNKTDASDRMVSLIAQVAEDAKVNVFRRWALMRHWHIHNNVALNQMIDPTDPDQLHQSDWSMLQFAKALCSALERATTLTM
jgi:GDSL-like Lipase/Acylhydrolase family